MRRGENGDCACADVELIHRAWSTVSNFPTQSAAPAWELDDEHDCYVWCHLPDRHWRPQHLWCPCNLVHCHFHLFQMFFLRGFWYQWAALKLSCAHYCLDLYPTYPFGIICSIVSQHVWVNTHLTGYKAIEVYKIRHLSLDEVWGQYKFSSVIWLGFYPFSLQESWQQFILPKESFLYKKYL